MQAIQVKYLQATNTKGVRIKAICAAGSITRERDYALNIAVDAMQVATELANSLNWLEHHTLAQGQTPDGNYVHLLVAK